MDLYRLVGTMPATQRKRAGSTGAVGPLGCPTPEAGPQTRGAWTFDEVIP